LVFLAPLAAQEPNRPDAAEKAEDLQYSVKVRGDKEVGKGKRLIIELTVVNESAREVTLDFATSGRVCGELFDPDNKRYARFPEVTLQVVGAETFPPKKKRILQVEVALEGFTKVVPGRHSVTAWLCGYGIQRAWAEFPLTIPRE
jgi:hypothetical protein